MVQAVRPSPKRYRRSLHIAAHWEDNGLIAEDYWHRVAKTLDPQDVAMLNELGDWRTVQALQRLLGSWTSDEVARRLTDLEAALLVIPEDGADAEMEEATGRWHVGSAARHFFLGTCNEPEAPITPDAAQREALRNEPPPNITKGYPQAYRVRLPAELATNTRPFIDVVLARRSTYSCAQVPMTLASVSDLLRLTLGQFGWNAPRSLTG